MDVKNEQAVVSEIKRFLTQIALELETSAAGARGAAAALPDHNATWSHVQQMYARFDQATRLLTELRETIDHAIPRA
jgi:hypothetical protein